MPNTDLPASLHRFGARSLALASALFAGWATLTWLAGPPSAPISAWVAAHRVALAWADELLMFAALALVPGGLVVARTLERAHPRAMLITRTTASAGVVMLVIADLALGRLVYPVFGLAPGESELASSVGGYYGALHAFDLASAATVAVFGGATRAVGRGWLALTVLTTCTQLLSAFPWLFDPAVVLALRAPWIAWLAACALLLARETFERTAAARA